MKRILLIASLCLTLISCGYDGNFRYPCQDPENWQAVECVPPVCHAYDYCTKDLIPDDALAP
jgi:hypothetical protein